MSLLINLQNEAEQVALSIQARVGELESEIRQKTEERARLVDELNQARLAASRLEKYPVVRGSHIMCPY